jgi:hypothetical protein
MCGTSGDAWERLAGSTGDAWERLIVSCGETIAKFVLHFVMKTPVAVGSIGKGIFWKNVKMRDKLTL